MIKKLLLKSAAYLFLAGIYLVCSNSSVCSADEQNVMEASIELHLAYSELNKGQIEEAIASFDKAISLDPQNAFSHYSLGLTYISLNENDLAIEQYNILKGLNKNLAEQLQNKIKLE